MVDEFYITIISALKNLFEQSGHTIVATIEGKLANILFNINYVEQAALITVNSEVHRVVNKSFKSNPRFL